MYSQVSKWGNSLLVREIKNANGIRKCYKTNKEQFTLYEPIAEKTEYVSYDDKINLTPINFNSIKEMTEYINKYSDIDNFSIYGQKNPAYSFISDNYDTTNHIISLNDYCIATFDIETLKDPIRGYGTIYDPINPIVTITIHNNQTDVYTIYGSKDEFEVPEDSEYKIRHIYCENEEKLLKEFLIGWESIAPDIVTGWNTTLFDIPYIINRCKVVFGGAEDCDKIIAMLSPFRQIQKRTIKTAYGKEESVYNIIGVSDLDYMSLYKKFTYSARDSYKLDNIASIELGTKKLDYSEVGDLAELYHTNYQKFCLYNVIDVALINKFEHKLKLINLIVTLAYMAKCNFADVFSPIRMWENIIYNELKSQNKFYIIKDEYHKRVSYPGGYVKSVIPGRKEWVLSVDLASLYPHIQMELNISPEKIIENYDLPEELIELREQLPESIEDKMDAIINNDINLDVLHKHNIAMSPNGQFYKRDNIGFLPKLLKSIYSDRKATKSLMIKKKQEREELIKQLHSMNNGEKCL